MPKKILVTGGAGFLGSHLVDELVRRGHKVRILDNLDPQVHGKEQKLPEYLNRDAEFMQGDVRNKDAVRKALAGIEVVFHEAAAVGVGQSMYQVDYYVDVNSRGAAILWEVLANEKHTVEKAMVASSMSIYGEGEYECPNCGRIAPKLRPEEQMRKSDWEMRCHKCGETSKPVPTTEEKPLRPTSVYAITKRDHEEIFISMGMAYKLPTVALRYFNIFGPRQALSNPYTGVAAIFGSRLLNKRPPIVYEDGNQTRDFIHVSDIVNANILAMENDNANYQVYNVGSGVPQPIAGIGRKLASIMGLDIQPEVTGQFRAGDIRHCYADASKIKKDLGFQPKVSFEDGMKKLVEWMRQQQPEDKSDSVVEELRQRGLVR